MCPIRIFFNCNPFIMVSEPDTSEYKIVMTNPGFLQWKPLARLSRGFNGFEKDRITGINPTNFCLLLLTGVLSSPEAVSDIFIIEGFSGVSAHHPFVQSMVEEVGSTRNVRCCSTVGRLLILIFQSPVCFVWQRWGKRRWRETLCHG